jgi:SAM-dependent methyltransferase
MDPSPKGNAGYCTICEQPTYFIETNPWLRDYYSCIRCASIPRNRASMLVLQQEVHGWRETDIYESGPGSALSDKLANEGARFTWSHYLPDKAWGTITDGVRAENLEGLTFPDESFDIVVTQDVFEHILRPELAFSEIARVLRPGGLHIFTVPLYRGKTTLVRAEPGPDGPVLLHPAEYHGDPVNPKGALVVREWGDDIVDFVELTAQMPTEIRTFHNRELGLDGEFLDVVVSRK